MRKHRFHRAGQSLVEFALVALVTYLLLAAILTFGFLFYGGQVIQSAADIGARELSRTPLPADAEFETVFGDDPQFGQVKQRIFDKSLLVFEVPEFPTPTGDQSMSDVIARWPVINQQLYPLMILDLELRINDHPVLRYPGTLITDPSTTTGYNVVIPLLNEAGTKITWIQVVEEIDTEADVFLGESGSNEPFDVNPTRDPFQISSPQAGLVALRINYPFQAATMTAYAPSTNGPFDDTPRDPVIATDSYAETNDPRGSLLERGLVDDRGTPETSGDVYTGPYGGKYGLGVHGALAQQVRPFRRVISAQAIFRREVFQ